MKSTNTNRIFNGFALVFAMAFGFILFAGSEVNAQSRDQRDDRRYDDRYNQNDRNDDDYYNNGQDDRYNDRSRNGQQAVRVAYQRGYQAGIKQARDDARNRRRTNGNNGAYGNNGNYGNNNGRYGNGNGNAAQLRQAYQSGFNRGYQESLRNNRNTRSGIGRILNLPF